MKLIETPAFLYSIRCNKQMPIWDGKLEILEGVHHTTDSTDTLGRRKPSKFLSGNKRRVVHDQEGMVYNGMVWLSEKNDPEAIARLINSEKLRVDMLLDFVDQANETIKKLKVCRAASISCRKEIQKKEVTSQKKHIL
jgi:hypothetical protein